MPNFEKRLSEEELKNTDLRAINDAELIEDGAKNVNQEITEQPRLEVTGRQIQEAEWLKELYKKVQQSLPIGTQFRIIGDYVGGTSTTDASVSRTGKTVTREYDNFQPSGDWKSGIIEESPNKDLKFYVRVDGLPDGHNQYEIKNVTPTLDGKVMMISGRATPQTLGLARRTFVTNISSKDKNEIVPNEELAPYYLK